MEALLASLTEGPVERLEIQTAEAMSTLYSLHDESTYYAALSTLQERLEAALPHAQNYEAVIDDLDEEMVTVNRAIEDLKRKARKARRPVSKSKLAELETQKAELEAARV